ncbi:MAG: 2,4'-dihydroxyacetophenone dioxygenase family protein [Burkholderiaceae bacterium]|uniref:2,4'-dihydroxyacetophenone dioxygenase family protein n=1 Tax=Herminiimonas sp. Marseille-P9896 TaxID=2742211 RepID=UPI00158E65C4|nr:MULTISPECIES: 2,4'-dihydroxyacetophenone dioxygenase family protein [Oxalobacteraceae]MBX9798584.1 2,4'-dihydroxyacetophenone dioxygenase family protein [Burkholderiaceae bacterium]
MSNKPNQSNQANPADTLFTCHPQDMQWLPWAMPGAHFKLLHANATTGHFTLLIRFEAGAVAPIHRHVGAVEGYMIEGGFYYHDEPERPFNAGCYLWENEGAIHQPVSPNGGVMFAVFHGPVEGLDADGNVIGRINWKWHVEKWNAAGNNYQPSV